MSQLMTVLALDFDGVICNSAEEVLQTALGTWSVLNPDSNLPRRFDEDPDVRRSFERLVPLGNRAEDFGVALHILSGNLDVRTQDEYDRIRTGLGLEWLEQFHHEFYQTRSRLRTDNLNRWLAFHREYPAFTALLERHQNDTTLAIATAKDGDSVRLLLRHFKIDHLFSDELILDKETGLAKTTHLKVLADRLNCDLGLITFVDDKLNHLQATAPLGVRGVLASWGHNTPREHEDAREAEFAVATLETVEGLLFGAG